MGNDDLIEAWRQTLHHLEVKRASYGGDAPVHLLNQIAFAKREIEALRREAVEASTERVSGATTASFTRRGTASVDVRLAVLQEQVSELQRAIRNGRLGKLERMVYWISLSQVLVGGAAVTSLLLHLIK
ncbi:MAG: hypothetical protein GXP39_06960 [Chloroflexi bacterium]|nr:hypothetical protein [Chloroflexota bacterium]